MDVLRTPDDRFENLMNFPYQPHYLMIDDGEGGELRTTPRSAATPLARTPEGDDPGT